MPAKGGPQFGSSGRASGGAGGARGGGPRTPPRVVRKPTATGPVNSRATKPTTRKPAVPNRVTSAAINRQNSSAKTYITSQPRTPAQNAASATTSARMKKVYANARKGAMFNKAVAAAGLSGLGVGFVVGQESQERRNRPVTTREPNRRQMAANRAKARKAKKA